jgi:hypothetical protein
MSKLPLGPERPIIISTKATKHYGVVFHNPWDAIRDKGRPKKQYMGWAGDRCDLMRWYIYKVSE